MKSSKPMAHVVVGTLTVAIVLAIPERCCGNNSWGIPAQWSIDVAVGGMTFDKDNGAFFPRKDRPLPLGPGLGFKDTSLLEANASIRVLKYICFQVGYATADLHFGASSLAMFDSLDYASVDVGEARWELFRLIPEVCVQKNSGALRPYFWFGVLVAPSRFVGVDVIQEGRDSLGIYQITAHNGTTWGFETGLGTTVAQSGLRVGAKLGAHGGGPELAIRTTESSPFESVTVKYSAVVGCLELGYQFQ